MEPSRLKLETYYLTKISIIPSEDDGVTPVGQFADFENADFRSEVTFHDLNNEETSEHRHGVELRLTAEPKSGKTFPYELDVKILGIFEADDLPADKRSQLVLVNGASMLYGALRELLLTLTFRCIHGPVMLPSVHFAKLAEEYTKEHVLPTAITSEPPRSNPN